MKAAAESTPCRSSPQNRFWSRKLEHKNERGAKIKRPECFEHSLAACAKNSRPAKLNNNRCHIFQSGLRDDFNPIFAASRFNFPAKK